MDWKQTSLRLTTDCAPESIRLTKLLLANNLALLDFNIMNIEH